jgi:hypothetical protein
MRYRVAVVSCLSLLFSLLLAVGYVVKNTIGFSPWRQMEGLERAEAFTVPPEITFVRDDLNAEARALKALLEVMNDERNKGLLCAGMAHLYRDALLSIGIPARKVILKHQKFSTLDSHVTVEAWINGGWRIYDPTFHITLKRGGERIGAFEAQDWAVFGKGKPFSIEFLGAVLYPARIEKYPLRYEAHFNNVFIELRSGSFPRHIHAYRKEDNRARHAYSLF